MEFREFDFEVDETRQAEDDNIGRFEGIANAFGVIDDYGSTFDPGAFKKTLDEQEYIPLAWFHDPSKSIGSAYLEEQSDGLKVVDGRINLDTQRGQEIYSGMQFDPPYVTEMSIGFDTIQSETDDEGVEHKKEAKLYEVSPLTKNFAANPQSNIEGVRNAAKEIQRMNKAIKEGAEDDLRDALQELREIMNKFDLTISSPSEKRPYEGEHACRLRQPGDFKDDSFRRVNGDRESDDKPIDVIYGKLEGEDTMTEQAYRYPDDDWEVDAAKSHCSEHDGIEFEPAEEEQESIDEVLQEARKLSTEAVARVTGGSRGTTSDQDSPQGDRDAGLDPRLVEEIERAATELT